MNLTRTGLGFRDENALEILSTKPALSWFEILIDNYMSDSAELLIIDQLCESYPITFHGVGLNIGSVDVLSRQYLSKLKQLQDRWEPKIISDHFSWTGNESGKFHELLALPHTKECIEHIVRRVSEVQEFLGRQIILENASTYVQVPSEMPEWEFINQICKQSGCGLLLDINNIHVNAFNHQFDVLEYVENIDFKNIRELHLAGYEDMGSYYLDSHSRSVSDEVWNTFKIVISEMPQIPCLLEWDNEIPSLNVLLGEIEKAERIRHSAIRFEDSHSGLLPK